MFYNPTALDGDGEGVGEIGGLDDPHGAFEVAAAGPGSLVFTLFLGVDVVSRHCGDECDAKQPLHG